MLKAGFSCFEFITTIVSTVSFGNILKLPFKIGSNGWAQFKN